MYYVYIRGTIHLPVLRFLMTKKNGWSAMTCGYSTRVLVSAIIPDRKKTRCVYWAWSCCRFNSFFYHWHKIKQIWYVTTPAVGQNWSCVILITYSSYHWLYEDMRASKKWPRIFMVGCSKVPPPLLFQEEIIFVVLGSSYHKDLYSSVYFSDQ